jgi:ABC-type Mn2+/Zn2+ transport system permease subunit
MNTFLEVLSPDFLLRNSVYESLLIGALCPLVGVFLVLRRMAFLGVALPQVSSAGIALAFCLPAFGFIGHGHAAHFEGDEQLYALIGSLSFTLVAVLGLAVLERRGRGWVEGRISTVYVLAGAWSILLVAKNPIAERSLLNLLQGEIVAVSNFDLGLTAVVLGVVAIVLFLFRREFLLVSYDREMALTLHKRVVIWDLLLYLLIGGAISIAVLSSGPLVSFGFLVLPPLTAYQLANTMRQFSLLASSIGVACAFVGFCIAFRMDLPLGPVNVALLGLTYGAVFLFRRLLRTAA